MISCQTQAERWEMIEPFEISREVITAQPVLLVRLSDGHGHTGQAEAAGVDYDGETPQTLAAQIDRVAPRLHDAITGQDLLALLPAGGARNALDCALWDLHAKQSGLPVWQAAGLPAPQPVTTAFTIGLGDEATTRRKAREARAYPLIKLKVDAQRHLDMVRWVREEHPGARLVVDANQGWTLDLLKDLCPKLARLGVEMVEQPLPRGSDALLDGFKAALPLAADESCTDLASLKTLVGRYQFINIKLDKCGGLTEALAMAADARELGLGLMVGNMCGTSLAMAPAFLLAQQCQYVDLDGPLLQTLDRDCPMVYRNGVIDPPLPALWG
ncbi:dipeptide epimerase [Rhodoferax sp. U2-2l]|uniref:N-acetyl-D-Glu racemase DgcA n=1 Tax=Rhodoferax sp. U2-2l TaxID=2884000 RepID=UPI001D0A86BC|nr:N-acetyl-D-Glu racemase DgcA [Rhodoferax sp. U2-2l]MCB8745992.1 dipeptide epimerase [Rhodoferax sp. U2-2l]